MVGKANIRHNFGVHDEMPVDDIEYKRTGGCFVSYRRIAIVSALIILLFAGVVLFLFTSSAHKTDTPETLLQFIERPHTSQQDDERSATVYDITPKNYRLSVQPVFNTTSNGPKILYGTVWVTFTPNCDRLQSVALRVASGIRVNVNNVFVYRSRIWNEASFDGGRAATAASTGYRLLSNDGGDETDSRVDGTDLGTESQTEAEKEFLETGDELTTDSPELQSETDELDDERDPDSDFKEETERTDDEEIGDAANSRPARHFTEIAVTTVINQPLHDTLIVSVALPLKRGHFYVLKVRFSGEMGDDSGFSSTSYANGTFGGTIYAKRAAFPHIPHDGKVTFDLEIQRRTSMLTIATAKLKSTDSIDPDHVVDVYHRTDAIRLSEFAFAVHQLKTIEIQSVPSQSSISAVVYLRPMLVDRNLAMIQSTVPEVMRRFENGTGLRMEMVLRIVLVPKMHSGWSRLAHGMIFISEDFFIANFDADRLYKAAQLGRLMFQTMLNRLLDNQAENDSWFSEAYPIYANPNEEIYLELRFAAMRMDTSHHGGTLSTYDKLSADDRTVIQHKGVSLLTLIESLLSVPVFRTGLKEYFKARLTSSKDNFFNILNDSIDNATQRIEFNQLVKMWTTIDHYPVIWIENKGSQITTKLTTYNGSSLKYNWIGPLELIGDYPNGSSNGSWFLMKPSTSSDYRVSYSAVHWNEQLQAAERNDNRLTSVVRACMADDLFNLARHGLANYTLVFRLLVVWSNAETEYTPWKAVIDNLQELFDAASGTDHFQALNNFVTKHIAKTFERIVQSPLHGDTISPRLQSLLTAFACTTLRLPQCEDMMHTEFNKLLVTTSNLSSIASTVTNLDDAYTVLCAAVDQAPTWSTWRLVYDSLHFGHDVDRLANEMIVRVLSCRRETEVLRAFVGLLSLDTMRSYRGNVFEAARRNAVTRMLVLEALFERHIAEPQITEMSAFFRSLSSDMELEMLQRIFEKNPQFLQTDPSVWSDIVSSIRSNIAWKQRLEIELEQIADLQ